MGKEEERDRGSSAQTRDKTNVWALLAICIANFVLPLNQFNIASVFSSLGSEFHQNVAGLGFASSLFFLGVLVSEIPGGFFASRYGAKRVMLLAILISSVSIILSSFSTIFTIVLISRLVAGLGVGASFPPMVGIAVQNMKKGSAATGIGLISLSFNLGGVTGLLGWAIIATDFGWRPSLFLSGGLGILCAGLLYITVHEKSGGESVSVVSLKTLRNILSIKKLQLLTIALIGISASATLVWNFMVYYLEGSLKVAPGLAGLISSLGLTFSIAAPFAGRVYERAKNTRRWIFFSTVLITAGVALPSVGTILSSIISVGLVGIGASMGYTVALTAATDLAGPRVEIQSIAVGWVDSMSIVGAFVSPIVFSLLVLSKGYQLSWLAGSLFSLVLVVPLLFLWHGSKQQDLSSLTPSS